MRFLLDTNVLIAAEPLASGELEDGAALAVELIGLANLHSHSLHSHPAANSDIRRNRNLQDRQARLLLLQKYPPLQFPPPIQSAITAQLGHHSEESNEWVDQSLIAAVMGNSVDFLVTEDIRLRTRAARVGLAERVMPIQGAISLIQRLGPTPSAPLPLVEQIQAHQLDNNDPIFDSLREDYPGFDEWLAKCQREHRTSWVIRDGTLAATTIVKDETPADYGVPGKTLKVCLFKVSDRHTGMRYGELLLKALLDYAFRNEYDSSYVTVFPKHEGIVSFLPTFGFSQIDATSPSGEAVFAKSLRPAPSAASMPPLEYHIAFGPPYYKPFDKPAFIVPIQPGYHDLLFPESNLPLLPERNPFGNSIRKAYLCNSGVRSIARGSVLYFYRSRDWHAITAVGIAEGTTVSSSSIDIARSVGRRTVYSYRQIEEMAQKETLAILFRQARILRESIPAQALRSAGIWSRPPQSIMRLEREGVEWLESRIGQ